MRAIIAPIILALAATLSLAGPLSAQLALPGAAGLQLPPVGGVLGDVTDRVGRTLDEVETVTTRQAAALLRARERALTRLLRNNRDSIALDRQGNLARRGELLVQDVNEAGLLALVGAGFAVIETEQIEGLDIAVTRLALPAGLELAEAEALAASLAPRAEVSADNIHLPAASRTPAAALAPIALQSSASLATPVGVIDGAAGAKVATLAQRGFAKGAPRASDHGSAVASLLADAGARRIRVADVYGSDPAGGNALAIARALGWLTASGSKVVTISLVGPRNSLVERAVKAAQDKGVVVVAAVGNDGPAAPPAYPASYHGVVAITGVDGKGRALIEAGRAHGLDYAAPGAGVYGYDRQGRRKAWRGTSFAAPLAAARIAAALDAGGSWRTRLDREARDLGARGPDPVYGRGLVCGTCGRRK